MRRERGWRASLALTLNLVALAFALSAVSTSYWCEGTRKVAKPFCTGPPVTVKQSFCIRFNSSNVNDSRLVQYIFETGEEKFLLRKFHTGIFFSCEQAADMNGKCLPAVCHVRRTACLPGAQVAAPQGASGGSGESFPNLWLASLKPRSSIADF